MWPHGVLVRVGGTPVLTALLIGLLLVAVAVVVLTLLLVLRRESVSTLLLPLLLFGVVSRVFNGRGHAPRPMWWGLV